MVDDVTQDVLIQLYRRAEQYDPQRSFWGWLFRVARNKYIDTRRRLRPGDIGTGGPSRPDDELEQWLDQLARSTDDPERAALEHERLGRIEEAVARLPAMQRTVVQLRREGVQGKEIARRIGRSQAYVSQSFHEALELIRDHVEN
jgi:RNA polymerase sigma-70 factor (ECF subfamily)